MNLTMDRPKDKISIDTPKITFGTGNSWYYSDSVKTTSITDTWDRYTPGTTNAAITNWVPTKYTFSPGDTYASTGDNAAYASNIVNNALTYYHDQTGPLAWKVSECGMALVPNQPAPLDRIRAIIRARQFPFIPNRSRPGLFATTDEREMRARETMRRVLGEAKFRRFVRDGHVTVRAKSGLVYQIFPGNGEKEVTCVFKKGVMIERLCVVLIGGFPATDSLIMRYLLILNDEAEFRGYALNHSLPSKSMWNLPDMTEGSRPLPEILAELKAQAA